MERRIRVRIGRTKTEGPEKRRRWSVMCEASAVIFRAVVMSASPRLEVSRAPQS